MKEEIIADKDSGTMGDSRRRLTRFKACDFKLIFVPQWTLKANPPVNVPMMYGALWFHRGERGCFPGIETLRRMLGLPTYKAAQAAVKHLKDRGWIEATPRVRTGGVAPDTNSYLFPVSPAMGSEAPEGFYIPATHRFSGSIGVPLFIARRTELKAGAKHLYGLLFGRSNNGACRLQRDDVAGILTCDIATYKRWISKLKTMGLIGVEDRGPSVNLFEILVHPWMTETTEDLRAAVEKRDRDSDCQTPQQPRTSEIGPQGQKSGDPVARIMHSGDANLMAQISDLMAQKPGVKSVNKSFFQKPLKFPSARGTFSSLEEASPRTDETVYPEIGSPNSFTEATEASLPEGHFPPPPPGTKIKRIQTTPAQRREVAMDHPMWKWLKLLYPGEGDFNNKTVRSFHYRIHDQHLLLLPQIYDLFHLPQKAFEEVMADVKEVFAADEDPVEMPTLPPSALDLLRTDPKRGIFRIATNLTHPVFRLKRLRRLMRKQHGIRYTEEGEPELLPFADFSRDPEGGPSYNRVGQLQIQSHGIIDPGPFILNARPGWERFWCILLMQKRFKDFEPKTIIEVFACIGPEETKQLRHEMAASAELYRLHFTEY